MTKVPKSLRERLLPFIDETARFTELSGGDTGIAWRVENKDRRLFLKYTASTGGMCRCEARNLQALTETGTVRLPATLDYSDNHLLMEYIEPGSPSEVYWETLATQLAALHRIEQPGFGLGYDNYCGGNLQLNTPMADGYAFFAKLRLGMQGDLAAKKGLLQSRHLEQLERLCRRLPELVPEQGPSLLHGDLWSGNHFAARDGLPVLVDPASYRGWPEAELAMLTLFGAAPQGFFDCYLEQHPLVPGWRQRFEIYNAYHLLNHLNLFGNAYLAPVEEILQRYG